jgi:hypothetical protein
MTDNPRISANPASCFPSTLRMPNFSIVFTGGRKTDNIANNRSQISSLVFIFIALNSG